MKKIVMTYGTFDMFHVGHLNILKRAKAFGEYLIVGVTSEAYDRSRGKLNVIQDVKTRVKTIEALDFVDEVIVEEHQGQKIQDMQQHHVDRFIIGDDWEGKFDYLKEYCEVIYLPRTANISSTLLRENIDHIEIGIIGTGRIANRFAKECNFVDGIIVKSVFSRETIHVESFIKAHDILYGFNNIDDFLNSSIEAVYIASPFDVHYKHVKASLLSGKHVLCEKPLTLHTDELKELITLAKEKELVFLEAIKTAYLPAFKKLLEELNTGVIGEIKEVRSTFTKLIEDRSLREWRVPNGGATNELINYPLLLSTKVLGKVKEIHCYDQKEGGVDSSNTVVCLHETDKYSFSTVGIGMKSEGSAVISGTKGYIYIPAPWWLTKEFTVKFEDPHKTYSYKYEFEGDGLRYEIAEFKSLIQRQESCSEWLTHDDMLDVNIVVSDYNKKR